MKKEELDRLFAEAENELAALNARKTEIIEKIRQLHLEKSAVGRGPEQLNFLNAHPAVDTHSSEESKINLFRSLFRGREDVYPRRFESAKTGRHGYQPVCRNEWVPGVCLKPQIQCSECTRREFLPITDHVIRCHLIGVDLYENSGKDFTIGVYPMLLDEACWLLAVDFDKTTWSEDALAFLETCRIYAVPAALERSRSGNGAHLWIFFSEPIPAVMARKLGAFLLALTLENRPEVGLDSYDRFFPSQDTLPKGGLGNLIALPLQKKPREAGNSVFLDEKLVPFTDQWAFLSSIQKMSWKEVDLIVQEADEHGEITGIRIPVTDENDLEPWKAPPSRRIKESQIIGPLPEKITLVVGNQIYIPKIGLPPSLRNRLVRLAAFQNPEFFQAQAMHLSTFGKPRIISCAEDFPEYIGLPRGCQEDLLELPENIKHPGGDSG